jgi:hypothetical protein
MSTVTDPSRAGELTRREFTLEAALALLAGCVITVTEACGSDSPTSATPPADVNAVISANHGHTGVVTGAQITAGAAITLDIQGSAVHHHTVAVSQADLQTLKNRQPVTHESSSDLSATFGMHSHSVTFTPA